MFYVLFTFGVVDQQHQQHLGAHYICRPSDPAPDGGPNKDIDSQNYTEQLLHYLSGMNSLS